MFCSPRQRASYEANQCLKRAPDFAAIDDATCGRVASELPVASALLIWRVIAQEQSLDPQKRLIKPHVCVIWRHQESKAWWQTEKFLNERTPLANVRRV
jgi:hypothetical protein